MHCSVEHIAHFPASFPHLCSNVTASANCSPQLKHETLPFVFVICSFMMRHVSTSFLKHCLTSPNIMRNIISWFPACAPNIPLINEEKSSNNPCIPGWKEWLIIEQKFFFLFFKIELLFISSYQSRVFIAQILLNLHSIFVKQRWQVAFVISRTKQSIRNVTLSVFFYSIL